MRSVISNDLLFEIIKMNKFCAILLTKEYSQGEKIKILSDCGYGPKKIAKMIDTTSNAVSVRLNALKKRTKK